MIRRPISPPPRRNGRGRLSRAARGAARRPWLTALVAAPTLFVTLFFVLCAMVLFLHHMDVTAKGCDGGGDGGAQPASYNVGDLPSGGADAPGPGTPPENFIPAYFAAASQPDAQLGSFGPYVLMGIHNVESNFGRSNLAGVKAGANFLGCCKGPFQFYDKPGDWSTWAAKSPISGNPYGRDGNGDGKVDIYDNIDSMFAAAALLYASGAPGDWHKALFSYNRSTAYGELVLSKARSFERTVTPPTGAPAPPAKTGGGDEAVQVANFSSSPAPTTTLVADTTQGSVQPADDDDPQGDACPVAPTSLVAPAEGGPYSPPIPAGSYTITTHFWTWRGSYNHAGTDLAAPEGTPFRAMGDGTVTIAGPYDPDGYGTYICIEHTLRLKSCYGHPSRIDVHVGETVKRGQVIGAVGQEGDSTGPHLHFEVWLDGSTVCPGNYVGVDPSEWCTPDAPGFNDTPGAKEVQV